MRARARAKLLRPVIAERETLYIDQLVEYALKSGFVRGQYHDQRGALNGFIEAIQELVRNGSGRATAERRRGRADGLAPSFFAVPPAGCGVDLVRWLAFAGRIRVGEVKRRGSNPAGPQKTLRDPIALGSRRETAPFYWMIR